MTREEIMALTGHELTNLVAEKVMGWKRGTGSNLPWYNPSGTGMFCPPAYALDIAAAWGVVEKMQADGWFHNHQCYGRDEVAGWFWTFRRDGSQMGTGQDSGRGEAAPLAICRAALLVF